MNDGDAVGAFDLSQGETDGLDQPLLSTTGIQRFVVLADEVGQDFRVGLRLELMSFGLKLLAEVEVILNDAVVDQGDFSRLIGMGVGVLVRWRSVRGPSGVADSRRPGRSFAANEVPEVVDSSGALAQLQGAAVVQSHSRGIIAPVFQPPESVQHNGGCIFSSDISDDSAHSSCDPDCCRLSQPKEFQAASAIVKPL